MSLTGRSIGFIGLGHMGIPIATNLLEAGYRLRVYNRSLDKVENFLRELPPLLASNVTTAKTVLDTLDGPDAVVTAVVANDAALESVALGDDGVLGGMGKGGILVVLSTVSPDIAERMSELYAVKGAHYISCPVFGRPSAAKAKKLIALPGGNAEAVEKILPLLQATSQKVVNSGGKCSNSNILKLCGNYMILAMMQAQAEAFTLAESAGIPREVVFDLVTAGLVGPMTGYGLTIAKKDYSNVGFTADNGLKDATLIVDASKKLGVHMPIAELVKERLAEVNALPDGHKKDWSSLADLVTINKKKE